MELAYTVDLKSTGFGLVGSNPTAPTMLIKRLPLRRPFLFGARAGFEPEEGSTRPMGALTPEHAQHARECARSAPQNPTAPTMLIKRLPLRRPFLFGARAAWRHKCG